MPKKKSKHLCDVPCPHCLKTLRVYEETDILRQAVKAEKEVTYRAEKATQTTLLIDKINKEEGLGQEDEDTGGDEESGEESD